MKKAKEEADDHAREFSISQGSTNVLTVIQNQWKCMVLRSNASDDLTFHPPQ